MKAYLLPTTLMLLLTVSGCGLPPIPTPTPGSAPETPAPLAPRGGSNSNTARPAVYPGSDLGIPGFSFVRTAVGASTFYSLPHRIQTVRRTRLDEPDAHGEPELIDQSPAWHRIERSSRGSSRSVYHLELRLAHLSEMNTLNAQRAIGQLEATRNVRIVGPVPGIRIETGHHHEMTETRIDRMDISNEFLTANLEVSVPMTQEPDFAAMMITGVASLPFDLFIVTEGLRVTADVEVSFPRSRLDPGIQNLD